MNLFKTNNVTHFTGEGDKKAAVVESFNRTWQRKYHKYKLETTFKTQNKQKIFDLVVKNYNLTPHTALSGHSPSEINRDVASELVSKQLTEREELRKKYSSTWRQVGDKRRQKKIGDDERRCETSKNRKKVGRRAETVRDKCAFGKKAARRAETLRDTGDSARHGGQLRDVFSAGDSVRISRSRAPFYKSYKGNFTPEVLVIDRKTRRVTSPDIICYRLKGLTGEEIKGIFYSNQLQKVYLPEKTVVEKILRKDKKKQKWLLLLRDFPEAKRRIWASTKEIKEKFLLPHNNG